MHKRVSVIVPVYNGERYLNRCVDSVLNQELINIHEVEIIMVNDGSSDSSVKILNAYKNKYPHIVRVITQQNKGVAEARNIGINMAKGVYTIFIDQDDFIENEYIYTFLKYAEKGSYDIVVGGYKRPDIEGKIIRVVRQSNGEYSKKYKISAAWAKMHRTEFLQNHGIKFYKNDFGEDIIFTLAENNKTKNIISIDYVGYNWFWNSKSVSNTKHRALNKESIMSIRDLIGKMRAYINNDLEGYYFIQTIVFLLLLSGRHSDKAQFFYLYKKLFDNFNNTNHFYHLKFFEFGPKGALLQVRLTVSIFVLLHHLKLVRLFAFVYCRGKTKSY